MAIRFTTGNVILKLEIKHSYRYGNGTVIDGRTE